MESKNLLAIRGLTRGNVHWGHFPNTLKKLFPHIELDLAEIPGNGTCFNETTPTDVEEVISSIRRKFKFDGKKFYIMGISLGGMVGLKWAELFPEEVLGVLPVNASLGQFSPFHKRLQPIQYSQLGKTLFERDLLKREKIVLGITSNNLAAGEQFLPEFSEFSKKHPIKHTNFVRQLLLASKIKLQKKPVVPVKIIYSQNDRLVHPSCSRAIANAFNLQASVHPEAGHDIPIDDPQWLAREAALFLD